MIHTLIEGLSWACLIAGSVFCLIGAVGLLRMPDFYTRIHAGSVTDTLGAGFILLGLMLQAGLTLVTAKLMMIGLLLFFSSPVAGHALAKAAMSRGLKPLLATSGDDRGNAVAGAQSKPTAPTAAAHSLEEAPSKP